jgi:type VI secretion system secreted protein VgrG
LSSAAKHIRAFANLGVRLIAGKGKIEIQAQQNNIEIQARQVIDFIAKQAINVHSDKRIRLQVGPHRIEITPSGGIELISPKPLQAHTGSVAFNSAQGAVPVSVESALAPEFSGKFQVKDKDTGKILAHKNYRIKTPQGKYFHGTTDENGYTLAVGGIQSAIFDIQIES